MSRWRILYPVTDQRAICLLESFCGAEIELSPVFFEAFRLPRPQLPASTPPSSRSSRGGHHSHMEAAVAFLLLAAPRPPLYLMPVGLLCCQTVAHLESALVHHRFSTASSSLITLPGNPTIEGAVPLSGGRPAHLRIELFDSCRDPEMFFRDPRRLCTWHATFTIWPGS